MTVFAVLILIILIISKLYAINMVFFIISLILVYSRYTMFIYLFIYPVYSHVFIFSHVPFRAEILFVRNVMVSALYFDRNNF